MLQKKYGNFSDVIILYFYAIVEASEKTASEIGD